MGSGSGSDCNIYLQPREDAQSMRVPLTPRSSSASSRWRGTTVTSSISHRNATSGGVRPGDIKRSILIILPSL